MVIKLLGLNYIISELLVADLFIDFLALVDIRILLGTGPSWSHILYTPSVYGKDIIAINRQHTYSCY